MRLQQRLQQRPRPNPHKSYRGKKADPPTPLKPPRTVLSSYLCPVSQQGVCSTQATMARVVGAIAVAQIFWPIQMNLILYYRRREPDRRWW